MVAHHVHAPLARSTPEAAIEQAAKEAELAPDVADDFDLNPEDEQALDVKDRPEVQVGGGVVGGLVGWLVGWLGWLAGWLVGLVG